MNEKSIRLLLHRYRPHPSALLFIPHRCRPHPFVATFLAFRASMNVRRDCLRSKQRAAHPYIKKISYELFET